MTRLELVEWEEKLVELDAKEARLLSELAGKALSVRVAGSDAWSIKAGSYVGGFRADDSSLLIRPKVKLDNLFELLGVSSTSHRWLNQNLGLDRDDDLLAAVVSAFVRALETALWGGVHRDYVHRRELVRALRGRPDFPALISRHGVDSPIPAAFDEYTPDVALNRYLVAGLRRVGRIPKVDAATRRKARQIRGVLETVQLRTVDPAWADHWQPTRLDRRFETSVRLSQLILRNMGLRDRVGGSPTAAFFVDMNDVFEKWVTDKLREALRPDFDVAEQVYTHLGTDSDVPMWPDIVVSRGGRAVLVADCKYKLLKGSGRSSDYYQALAYATAYGLRDAILIYALVPGATPAAPVRVRNSSIRLHAFGVDLSRPAGELGKEIDALAAEVRRLAGASVGGS